MSKRAAPSEDTSQTETEAPRSKRPRSSFSKIIKVLVGPDDGIQETIIVHEDLICNKCEFFKAACKKEWTPAKGQGKERIIPLPTHEPEIFCTYLERLYNPDISFEDLASGLYAEEISDDPTSETEKQRMAAVDILCKLWILADFLGDTQLAAETLDELATTNDSGRYLLFSAETLEHITAETSEDSMLQQLVVDYLAMRLLTQDIDMYRGSNISSEFLLRIMRTLVLLRDAGKTRSMEMYMLKP